MPGKTPQKLTDAERLKILAENVKRLGIEKGLTQTQLADQIGVSLRYIQRLEQAEYQPRILVVMDICKVLGTFPSEIISKH